MASYAEFYNQYDTAVRNGADIATQAGLDYVRNLFPIITPLFVITIAILGASGRLTMGTFVSYVGRLALVMWLVIAGAFTPHIRDLIVDEIPASVARQINGSVDDRMGPVAQFQMIDDAAAHYVAEVTQVATGISQIGNRIAAWFARGLQKIFLFFMFVVWISMRQLAYLTCAVLAFTVIFLPFESTRGIFTGQLHRLFGITMWQVSASILLKIMLGGVQIYLKQVSTVGLTLSIDQQIDQCLDIAMFFMGMCVLFMAIPYSVGIYASGAAASSIASGAMMVATTNISRAATSIQRAGISLNKSAREMSGSLRRGS
jgi:hypothetical protein